MFGFAFCNKQNSGKIAFCKKQKVALDDWNDVVEWLWFYKLCFFGNFFSVI
jgi:hypothetical protein